MKRVLAFLIIIAILFESAISDIGGLSFDVSELSPYITEDKNQINLYSISDDYYSDAQLSFSSDNEIDVDAPEGWELYQTLPHNDEPVIVAIIDTGVDYLHEDLASKMWINENEIPDNGIDDDGNGYIDDVYGWNFCNNTPDVCSYLTNDETGERTTNPDDNDNHGTHIAGIIAAEADNQIGVAGLASYANVKIMSLKIHGGDDKSGNVARAIEAIKYAELMGASVCNISWGTYTNSNSLYKTIANSSMLFSVAAGNNGSDNDIAPIYPANYDLPNVISVAVTSQSGNLTSKANYGIESVDIAVPASEVYSTIVGGYAYMGGSSMAAPHVSAIASVLFTLNQDYSASDIKKLICLGAKPVSSLKKKIKFGGIASLYNTLEASTKPFPDEIPPTFSLDKKYCTDGIIITINAEDEGGSGVAATRYFIGECDVSTFKKGTGGRTFNENNTVLIQKSGKYTFYVMDGDGNETIKTYLITTDTLAPSFKNVSYSVAKDYSSITISGACFDSQSGVKNIKYLKGLCTIKDFNDSDSKKATLNDDNTFSFTVNKEGIYTVLARDNSGNKAVYTIRCYIRKAQSITLPRKHKTLSLNKTYKINPTVTPISTTDTISYKSSDKTVCKVNSNGIVTAVGVGTATVTVKTSSGCRAKIEIKVTE